MLAGLQRHWRAILILAVIWIVFECWISWSAFCDSVNKQTEQNAAVEYECVFGGPILSAVRFFHGWWKRTFDQPDAYVALFTAVLAFFTLALWRSTDKFWRAGENQIAVAKEAAEAAKLNAQAVINAERARLYPVIIESESIDHGLTGAVEIFQRDAGIPGLKITYRFKNYGKTPAMVREIKHGVVIVPELPKERTYSALVPLPVEPIVGGNDKTGPIDINIPNVTVGTAQDIRGWKTILWFYGNVVYDDTFGWQRTLYFEFYYDGSSRGLRWWDCRETEKKRQT